MDFILQNIFLVAIAVISGTMLLVLSVRRPGGRSALNAGQATMLINREDALVVDVREPDEYVSGHVPDARNIPLRVELKQGTQSWKDEVLMIQEGQCWAVDDVRYLGNNSHAPAGTLRQSLEKR